MILNINCAVSKYGACIRSRMLHALNTLLRRKYSTDLKVSEAMSMARASHLARSGRYGIKYKACEIKNTLSRPCSTVRAEKVSHGFGMVS